MPDSPRIEELKRRVQSDPASIAFAALAEEYRRAGRFDEAIETCTAGLVRHPSYLSAHVTLGRALIDVGRLEEAREELQHVLKLAPENLAAIRGLAEIHERVGPVDRGPLEEAAPEPPAGEMTVAEIHAASGFKPAEPEVPSSAMGISTDTSAAWSPVPALQGTGSDPASQGTGSDPRQGSLGRTPLADSETPQSAASFLTEEPPVPVEPAIVNFDSPARATGPDSPADEAILAGLQQFLAAIQRARSDRIGAR
jgi:tetratricopeptide (TPR) repeat protein